MTTAKQLWNSVWEAVETDRLDDLEALFTEDALFRTSSAEGKGREYAKGVLTRHSASYPDLKREIVSVTESADEASVVIELIFSGTHLGTLKHPNGKEIPPTGRRLTWRAFDKVTAEDGKIVGWTALFDRLCLLDQLS